jgi:hypothetical protein
MFARRFPHISAADPAEGGQTSGSRPGPAGIPFHLSCCDGVRRDGRGEMVAVAEPREIDDELHEQILGRVAAADVAKPAGMVCTRVPYQRRPGKRHTCE